MIINRPTQNAALCHVYVRMANESNGTITAPPSLNAALLMPITMPRFRTNHMFRDAVVACMKLVEAPIEMTSR